MSKLSFGFGLPTLLTLRPSGTSL